MTRPFSAKSFTDGVQAFLDRIVNEPAGVDDDQVAPSKVLEVW
jgi:hypothetical protein